MINHLNHTHPLYKSDNNTVYSLLEVLTCGSVYAPTIKAYSRPKNGRVAWISLMNSHAGSVKWEQLMKDKTRFLINTKWNGRNYSLEKFTGLHRNAFVQLQETKNHIDFQLPTDHTRVGYSIDNIQNPNPDLRCAISNIRLDSQNMRTNFEAACCSSPPGGSIL